MRKLGSCIRFQVIRIPGRLQEHHVTAGIGQDGNNHQLIIADASLIQDFGHLVFTKLVYDAFKLIVQPAHAFNICIFQHIFRLA